MWWSNAKKLAIWYFGHHAICIKIQRLHILWQRNYWCQSMSDCEMKWRIGECYSDLRPGSNIIEKFNCNIAIRIDISLHLYIMRSNNYYEKTSLLLITHAIHLNFLISFNMAVQCKLYVLSVNEGTHLKWWWMK